MTYWTKGNRCVVIRVLEVTIHYSVLRKEKNLLLEDQSHLVIPLSPPRNGLPRRQEYFSFSFPFLFPLSLYFAHTAQNKRFGRSALYNYSSCPTPRIVWHHPVSSKL